MVKSAVITGVNGQDGAWLARHLVDIGYQVVGVVRRGATDKLWRLRYLDLLNNKMFSLASGDVTDYASMESILKCRPDEVYNLAAQSHVGESFKAPIATAQTNYIGVANLLEVIAQNTPDTKFYQASTSEQMGRGQWKEDVLMNENTSFHPRSPYGVAKVAAHYLTQNYREAYNIFGCCGILFNHGSELRQDTFVTAKICKGAALIAIGEADKLELGNLDAKRDWGYAPDYVRAMNLILQQEKAEDFVIATGQTRSVREFCDVAFGMFDLDYKKYVVQSDEFYRPADVGCLIGDSSKAKEKLEWEPETSFEEMVANMCEFWMDMIQKGDKYV